MQDTAVDVWGVLESSTTCLVLCTLVLLNRVVSNVVCVYF